MTGAPDEVDLDDDGAFPGLDDDARVLRHAGRQGQGQEAGGDRAFLRQSHFGQGGPILGISDPLFNLFPVRNSL